MCRKKVMVLVLCALLIFGAIAIAGVSLGQQKALADDATFYSTASDGFLEKGNISYTDAHNASNADWVRGSFPILAIGQALAGTPSYFIQRGALFFDTSSLPDNAHITSAMLSLRGYFNDSTTDFDITVVDGSLLNDPLVAGDYGDLLNQTTSGGVFNTAGFSYGYNDIPLNAAGMGWISKTGMTRLGLRSSRDITATAPVDFEHVGVHPSESAGGDEFRPKLVITYEYPPIESDHAFLPPTIDGEFSDGEWTGPQLLIDSPIPTNVYFSNDDTFLYVCVDAANGVGGDFTQNGSDHCLFVFDTDHDEYTSEGRENMFKLYGNGYKEHRVAHSDGSYYWIDDPNCDFDACPGFPGLEGVVGFGPSPNSPLNHRIYEFKIPLSLLGASPGDTIGFASPRDPESIPYDGDTFIHNMWPSDATATDLATWGDLVLASTPPPSAVPTVSQWGIIGLAIALAAALVWSVRRRWVVRAGKS